MSNVYETRQLVEELYERDAKPFIIKSQDGREFMASPSLSGQWNYNDITAPNTIEPIAPKIITQAVKVQDVQSMTDYVNRFKNGNSVLFADISTSTILGVIDYHSAPVDIGEAGLVTPPTADHTKHSVSLTLPFSIEWQTWLNLDGKLTTHLAFANFLEENAMDILPLGELRNRRGEIVENAPTTILELCRTLQIVAKFDAMSEVRNGDYVSFTMQRGRKCHSDIVVLAYQNARI